MIAKARQVRSRRQTPARKTAERAMRHSDFRKLEQRLGKLALLARQIRSALHNEKPKRAGGSPNHPALQELVAELISDYQAMLGNVSDLLRRMCGILNELESRKGK